jgi:F0F1-type ATP synthase membrane subunit b/b'
MSIQDPPYGSNPNTPSAGDKPFAENGQQGEGVLPAADAAKLREAGSTVRDDFNSALETAKSDLGRLVDAAKRDLSAVKDEAVSQFQNVRGQVGGNAQSLTDQANEQLQSLKGQAQDQFQSLKGEAESRIGDATGRARAFAGEQVGQLTNQARSFATQQKDLAAQQIGGVVDAVSRVADELQTSQGGTAVAGYAQDLAGSLRGLADTVQNKSVDELFGMVQDFGKRQPLAFLGIAALTGFAASRFILASRHRAEEPVSAAGYPAGSAYPTDRGFGHEAGGSPAYRDPGSTAVELDRSTDATENDLRGVADNGRI